MGNDLNPSMPAAPASPNKLDTAKAKYIALARQRYTAKTYDIEIDDVPIVGIAEYGAWVASWLWVGEEEVGVCNKRLIRAAKAKSTPATSQASG